MVETLGLIAGMGILPRAIAEGARRKGYRVFAIGLEPIVDESLKDHVDEYVSINVGKLGAIMKALKGAQIQEAVMGGKVPKTLMYEGGIKPDMKAVTLLFKIKDRTDDSIMLAIAEEFHKDGIVLRDITDFTTHLLMPEGVITKKKPTKEQMKDIAFGFPLAKEMGRLDIGQTVVVKDQAVMAIEAIEGTDKAIHRGGMLARSGAVVVKVSKPNQDKRFDYPAVGLNTLMAMKESQAAVLALEAGQTLLIQKEEMLEEATRSKIIIIGVTG